MSDAFGLLLDKMTMRVLAIDPSLVSTGYAYRDGDGEIYTGCISTKKMTATARLDYILRAVTWIIAGCNPDLIAYEGYAMGIKGGGRVFDIGELGGVLKHHFWKTGNDVLLVPPTSMKMFVTGNGCAKKPIVAGVIERELGIVLATEDESDAVGLLMVGEAFTGGLHLANGERRVEALAGCQLLSAMEIRRRTT